MFSLIPLAWAMSRGIEVPIRDVTLPIRTAAGTVPMRVRPGRIRAWWNDRREGWPYHFPALFQVDPTSSAPPLLGLAACSPGPTRSP